MKLKVVIEKDEDGYFVAWVPSLPGCVSQGKTLEEAKNNIKEALDLHLCSLEKEVKIPKKQVTLIEVEV